MKIFEVTNPYQKTFGDGIRKYINEQHITQADLADAIGISHSHLSNLLSGRAVLYYDNMVDICKALGIDQLVIFMEEDKHENHKVRSMR